MTADASLPLLGRRALVIGAGTPAGGLAARTLAGAGADVAVAATSLDGEEVMAARRVRRAVEALGRRAAEYAFDIALPTNVRVSMRQVAKEMGGLEILVNSADLYLRKGAEETTDADWSRVFNQNLFGVFYACRAALHEMRATGGRIITITSVLGDRAESESAAYCAARHGVSGLTRSLAIEYADRNVTVNAIALDFSPAQVAGQSLSYSAETVSSVQDALSALLLRLCSDAGAAITGELLIPTTAQSA